MTEQELPVLNCLRMNIFQYLYYCGDEQNVWHSPSYKTEACLTLEKAGYMDLRLNNAWRWTRYL